MFRMTITMSLPLYTGLICISYCWTLCLCNTVSVLERPSDVRLKIGSDVVFRCVVDDISDVVRIRWLNNETSEFISQNDEIWNRFLSAEQQGRFAIKHKTSTQFDLEISRILYSDKGWYECVFMYYDQDWIKHSFNPPAIAQLTVLKEPSRDSPNCTIADENGNVLPTGRLQGDDRVQFQCSSRSHGTTSPNLTLFVSGTAKPQTDIVVDKTDLKTITTGVVSPRQGMKILCVLESEALLKTKTCQLMPDVRPVVSIQPNNVIKPVGSETKFSCLVSGFPTDTIIEYKWEVFPELHGNVSHQVNSSSIFYITVPEEPFNCSFFLVVCTVYTLNGTNSISATLRVETFLPSDKHSVNITKDSNEALAVVLPLLVLVIIVMIVLFLWRRHRKQKLNRFKGLHYTIEPSTNSNTNVPIHGYSETCSGNIYSGPQSEKPFSRSSSIKDNLYARIRKFRKSQEISAVSPPPTTADDSVNETVRAIIENHRLSGIDHRLSGVEENPGSIKEECSSQHLDSEDFHSSIFEDHSNEECTAHIYENIIIKSENP